MATQAVLNNLKTLTDTFKKVDRTKLLRSNLGDASLASQFEPTLDEIERKIEFAIGNAEFVHDSYVNAVKQAIDTVIGTLLAHAARPNAEYVANREAFIQTVDQQLQVLQQFWPFFIASAVELRGFLQDEGIQREYQRTVDSIKKESGETLEKVRAEAEKTIGEAKRLAEEIEQRARRTAAHISVEEAQTQLGAAIDGLNGKVRLWGVLSVLALVAFFVLVAFLIKTQHLPDNWTWQIVYFTSLRIALLGAAAAVATFALRMLRAYTHMVEFTKHRRVVTNSMAAFVESAVTPEQRDLILGRLVDAVATFGDSGLLGDGETKSMAKMSIDTFAHSFMPPIPKEK